MQYSLSNNKTKPSKFGIGDKTTFLNLATGKFASGTVECINNYKNESFQETTYRFKLDEEHGVQNVPERLVFSTRNEAIEWVNSLHAQLIRE